MTLKETPLYKEHLDLGAKMAPFAGFSMPVSYKGIIEEHLCVRNNVGIFDVSHMGEFLLKGKESVEFLNYVTTGNFSTLKDGKARYTILCNEHGGIIDDIIVYRFHEDEMLVCVNASNIEKDWKNLSTYSSVFDITFEDVSATTGLIAVQGPSVDGVMSQVFNSITSGMKPFSVIKVPFMNEDVIIASTGYTGEKGFEIFASADVTKALWNEFLVKGVDFHIEPIGLGARDTLRLEKKYPLYGNDLDDDTSPVEAGLVRFIDDTKERYIGKNRIHEELMNGTTRKWVSLKITDKRIPRHGYDVYANDKKVGVITSGTFSPSLSYPIATAYISPECCQLGTNLVVDIRGRLANAEVTSSPFL